MKLGKIILLSVITPLLLSGETLVEKVTDANGNTKITKTTLMKGDGLSLGTSENKRVFDSPEFQAMLQEAYQRGYTAGSENSMREMNMRLIKMEKYMDGLFAFHRLTLEGKFEPPKIGVLVSPVEVNENGKTMHIQARTYTVLEEGKFVNEIKDWKSFLLDGDN